MQAEQIYKIIHSLPGRLRVRLPCIYRDPSRGLGLEEMLNGHIGVSGAHANTNCASLTINFNPEQFDPIRFLDRLDVEEIERVEKRAVKRANKSTLLPAPLSSLRRSTFAFETMVPPKAQFWLGAASLVASLIEAPVLITGAVLGAAVAPILNRAVQTALVEKRLGADALDGSSCLLLMHTGNFVPAALMTSLIGLGEFIRDLVSQRCEKLIEHNLALCQRSAWLVKGHHRIRIPVTDLKLGDRMVVYPGELIPCQGTVISGRGTLVPADPEIDFAARYAEPGEQVDADLLLMDGKLYLQYEQNLLERIADPIRQKHQRRWLQRTKLHRNALKTGYNAVWPLLSAAGLVSILTGDIHRALTILCFDFITGIKIAIPTAVLSSMFSAGNKGIVVRNATALENLAELDAVIFARSGVLTELTPSVTDVFVVEGFALEEVTTYAAAVAQRFDHFGAYAIYSFAQARTVPVPERTNSSVIPGLGVKGDVQGHTILVGRTRLMENEGIDLSAATAFLKRCEENGDSRACVAIDGKLAGVISYQDPMRADVPKLISALKQLGVKEIAMMTGGSKLAAETLAKKAGISTAHYRALPEDQSNIVKSYKRRGLHVAVVGYDVDDALALEQADVSITFSTGADVARHRADVVLTSDNLMGIVQGIETARMGMNLARQNMVVVSLPNVLGLALSLVGEAEVFLAMILNNGSVIVGAANGLRPLLDTVEVQHDEDCPDDDSSTAVV